jgi:hypothetical protein
VPEEKAKQLPAGGTLVFVYNGQGVKFLVQMDR